MNSRILFFVILITVFGCSSEDRKENEEVATESGASDSIFNGVVDEVNYVYHYNSDDKDGSKEKIDLESDPALSILVQADDFNEDMISVLGTYFNHRVYLTSSGEVELLLKNFSFSKQQSGLRNDESCETFYRDLFILYSKQKYVGCIKVDFNCGTYVFVTQDPELLKLTKEKGLFLNLDPSALKSVLVKNKDRKDF